MLARDWSVVPSDKNDGYFPYAGLILDASGNLYGTTTDGYNGHGTIFKIPAAGGTLTVLHRFGDGTVANDGMNPFAGLILDPSGNLYGTTSEGGSSGTGTVFKLSGTTYFFSGFLAPVNNAQVINTGKAGKTYPVRWSLTDSFGNYISAFAPLAGLWSATSSITSVSIGRSNVS